MFNIEHLLNILSKTHGAKQLNIAIALMCSFLTKHIVDVLTFFTV